MRENEDFLAWCLDKNRGIRRVEPSDNLAKAYQLESKTALRSMQVNAQAGILEWAVSASYYARYFASYSVLAKIGIKCGIHDCTIALFEYLLGNRVPAHMIRELKRSKENRVELQYYTTEWRVDLMRLEKETREFLLEIEKILDGLTQNEIASLRSRFQSLDWQSG